MIILEFIRNLDLMKLYIILSFIIVTIFYNSKNKTHLLVFILISTSVINEILSCILLSYNHSLALNANLYTVIHNCIWLLILKSIFKEKKIASILLIYIAYSAASLMYLSILKYNFYLFIVGAVLYCIIFIVLCYQKLFQEKFKFFKSNNFYLAFAPVMFFLGLSMIFSFQNSSLAKTKILFSVSLYTLIIYFANFIYYTLINIYIYKERSRKNGK